MIKVLRGKSKNCVKRFLRLRVILLLSFLLERGNLAMIAEIQDVPWLLCIPRKALYLKACCQVLGLGKVIKVRLKRICMSIILKTVREAVIAKSLPTSKLRETTTWSSLISRRRKRKSRSLTSRLPRRRLPNLTSRYTTILRISPRNYGA